MRDHRNPRSSCCAIRNAIASHGWDKFTVTTIEDGLSQEEALAAEVRYIAEHNTRIPAGYNITAGGQSGRAGMTHVTSDHTKQLLREAHLGTHHTEATKRLLSEQRLCHEYQDNQRRIRSTPEFREKLLLGQQSPAMVAEKHKRQTSEYREQARQRRLGVPHSEARKLNIIIALLQRNIQRLDAGERVGISLDKRSAARPWIVRARLRGTVKYVGAFATESEAICAYRKHIEGLIEFYQACVSAA